MSVRSARPAGWCLAALACINLSLPLYAQAPKPAPSSAAAAPGKAGKAPAAAPLPPAVKRAAAQFERAVALHRARKVTEAIAAYKEYLRLVAAAKLPPNAALPAYQNLAVLYQFRNDLKGAEESYRQVVKLDPHNANAYAQLATIYLQLRRFDEARQAADRALSLSPPKAAAAPAHFALGIAASVHNDLPAAAKELEAAVRLAPSNPQAHLNLGFVLARQKKYRPALDELEKARTLQPKLTPALFYIAAVKQEMGDLRGALAAYEAALQQTPHDPLALFNRALLLQKLGKTQEAITAYLATLEAAPQSYGAHLNVGALYYDIGNYEAARRHYAAALKLKPGDTQALLGLAYAETQAAAGQVETAARDAGFKEAETHFKQALAGAPKNQAAQNGLGYLYERMGRFDDALALYRQMQAAAPDDIASYYRLTRVYTMQRKVDEVVTTWQRYRARKPDDPTSYEEAAHILEAQSRLEPAIAEWRQLLDRKPNPGVTANAMVSIGNDLALLKRPEEARTQYKAVLALDASGKGLDPKIKESVLATLETARMEALRGLAKVAESEGKADEAIAWLNQLKALERTLAAKTGQPPNAQTYLAIARAYEQAKKPDMAIAEYRALAEVASHDPTPYMQLGRLYDAQNRLEEAVAAYREAARRTQDPVEYRLEIADLYRRKGKLDLALAEYAALQTEHPTDRRLYDPMARAYEQAGQYEKALAAYDALLKVDPTATWVEDRKAVALIHLKRYAAARSLYEQMLDRNPNSYQTYADLAHVYKLEGKPEAYLPWLQARFEKAPGQRTLMAALIDEYARLKREEEGWAYLHGIAEKHKTDRPFLEAYAGLLTQRNHGAQALDIYRQIADQNPADLAAQTALIDQLDLAGNKAEATRLTEKLAARADLPAAERAVVRRRLAQRYAQEGKTAEAISLYQEIVRTEPNDFLAAAALARLLTTAGREAEAIPLYMNLANQAAYPPEVRAQIRVRLGSLYEKRGNKADAIGQYREALKISPQNAEAAAGLKRLGG
ncbi:MAG TPA: tetratricopeptide repeat protein [Chthonomonadaceae bacterium]|nr:tetratricopeptide repeat protein [Chthonomonadaceae bacterium]